jgi:DNA-binding response OmpR family regulator
MQGVAEKTQIMIVEDDPDLSEMLNSYFRVQGYEVLTASWGEDAVRLAKEHSPQLVMLDIRLPDIDGYEVCRQIRTNRRTQDTPVIFLTEKRDRVDKLAGLELGVVDYITKPFDIQELRLRVRNALRRTEQSTLYNPVTNIPETPMVEEKITQIMLGSAPWASLVITISGLDAFREMYGFVNADDVLRAVTLMMNNAIREVGTEADFVGHFGPADFIIITDPGKVNAIRDRVEGRIRQSMEYFYPLKDREKARQAMEKGHLRLIISQFAHTDTNIKDMASMRDIVLRNQETS